MAREAAAAGISLPPPFWPHPARMMLKAVRQAAMTLMRMSLSLVAKAKLAGAPEDAS
jgi:hypothetical protein